MFSLYPLKLNQGKQVLMIQGYTLTFGQILQDMPSIDYRGLALVVVVRRWQSIRTFSWTKKSYWPSKIESQTPWCSPCYSRLYIALLWSVPLKEAYYCKIRIWWIDTPWLFETEIVRNKSSSGSCMTVQRGLVGRTALVGLPMVVAWCKNATPVGSTYMQNPI